MKARRLVYLVVTVGFFLIACQKKELGQGSYVGNFWGKSDEGDVNALNVPLHITYSGNNLLVNGENILEIEGDSIFGSIDLDDSTYSIYPYICGTWFYEKKIYTIQGSYAALKGLHTTIHGNFEIISD